MFVWMLLVHIGYNQSEYATRCVVLWMPLPIWVVDVWFGTSMNVTHCIRSTVQGKLHFSIWFSWYTCIEFKQFRFHCIVVWNNHIAALDHRHQFDKKEVSKSLLLRDRKLGQKLLTAHCVNEKKLRAAKKKKKNKQTTRSSSSVSFAFRSWCHSFTCLLAWKFLPPDDNVYMHQFLFILTPHNSRAHPANHKHCVASCQSQIVLLIIDCHPSHRNVTIPGVRLKKQILRNSTLNGAVCVCVSHYHRLYYRWIDANAHQFNFKLFAFAWNNKTKYTHKSNQL